MASGKYTNSSSVSSPRGLFMTNSKGYKKERLLEGKQGTYFSSTLTSMRLKQHGSARLSVLEPRRCVVGGAALLARPVIKRLAPSHAPSSFSRTGLNTLCFAATTSAGPTVQATPFRTLHPLPKFLQQGTLQVSPLHTIAYAVYGNPRGLTAVVLHGGPGAGCWPNHTRFFDPAVWRIVLVDQRGCGASSPRGCLVANTTQALVSDLERLRQHLGISQWALLGGSWGVTLALAYAQLHPARTSGIILRGVCLMRPKEIKWMYGGGAGMLHPLSWHEFVEHVAPGAGGACEDVLLAYYRRLLSPNPVIRDAAALAWMRWEMAVGFHSHQDMQVWDGSHWSTHQHPAASQIGMPGQSAAPSKNRKSSMNHARGLLGADTPPVELAKAVDASLFAAEPTAVTQRVPRDLVERAASFVGDASMSTSTAQALLECHYSMHNAFLQPLSSDNCDSNRPVASDSGLLSPSALAALRLQNVPCIAIQGQMDGVCPPGTAYALHLAWPEMELRLVPNAGHSMYDPRISHELLNATDRLAAMLAPYCVQDAAGVVAGATMAGV